MNVEYHNELVVVQTSGYFNQELGQGVLTRCSQELANGKIHYFVNMKESKMVNSIGVSMLIELIDQRQDVNGSLSFCHLAPVVDKTFKIMGISKFCKSYPTLEEALTELSTV